MRYELKAYANTDDGRCSIKFFENADTSVHNARYFHVTLEGKPDYEDLDAHFNNYTNAKDLFKKLIVEHGITKVFISDAYMEWLTAEPDYWDEKPSRAEEYEEACMAEAYGEPSLMRRYNRKYGIEEEYGPSNPWDAPGMSVGDFI